MVRQFLKGGDKTSFKKLLMYRCEGRDRLNISNKWSQRTTKKGQYRNRWSKVSRELPQRTHLFGFSRREGSLVCNLSPIKDTPKWKTYIIFGRCNDHNLEDHRYSEMHRRDLTVCISCHWCGGIWCRDLHNPSFGRVTISQRTKWETWKLHFLLKPLKDKSLRRKDQISLSKAFTRSTPFIFPHRQ